MGELKDPRKNIPETLEQLLRYSPEHKIAFLRYSFRPILDFLPEDAKKYVLDNFDTFSNDQLNAIITVQQTVPLVSRDDNCDEAISAAHYIRKYESAEKALSAFIAPWFLLENMLEGPNFFDTPNTWPAVASRVKEKLQKLFMRGIPEQMEVVKLAEDMARKIENKYRDQIMVRDEFMKAAQPILEDAERTRSAMKALQHNQLQNAELVQKQIEDLRYQNEQTSGKLNRAQNIIQAKAGIEKKYAELVREHDSLRNEYDLFKDAAEKQIEGLERELKAMSDSSESLAGDKTSLELGLKVSRERNKKLEAEVKSKKKTVRRYALYTAASLVVASYSVFYPVHSTKAEHPKTVIAETSESFRYTPQGIEISFDNDTYILPMNKVNDAYEKIEAREFELKRFLRPSERLEIIKQEMNNRFYAK